MQARIKSGLDPVTNNSRILRLQKRNIRPGPRSPAPDGNPWQPFGADSSHNSPFEQASIGCIAA